MRPYRAARIRVDLIKIKMNDIEPTDLEIAISSADATKNRTTAVLLAEYRKVHRALVRLDHIHQHDMNHPGYRPDWLRDALAGNRCRVPSDVEIAEGYEMLASESQREAAETADEKPDGQAENA